MQEVFVTQAHVFHRWSRPGDHRHQGRPQYETVHDPDRIVLDGLIAQQQPDGNHIGGCRGPITRSDGQRVGGGPKQAGCSQSEITHDPSQRARTHLARRSLRRVEDRVTSNQQQPGTASTQPLRPRPPVD